MRYVLVFFGGVILIIWGMAAFQSSAAQAETARAAVEAARAAQIASAGQTMGMFWMGMIATLAMLGLVGLIGLFVWLKVKQLKPVKTGNGAQRMPTTQRMDPTTMMMWMMMNQMMGSQTGSSRRLGPGNEMPVIEPDEEESPVWWEQ